MRIDGASLLTQEIATSPDDIFITRIKTASGKEMNVISSKSLGESSIHINHQKKIFLFFTLMAVSYINNENPYLSRRDVRQLTYYRNTVPDVWATIFSFVLGSTETVGAYALCTKKPSLFYKITMDPIVINDAAIRGQNKIVMNILNANPTYLLGEATVRNSVDVEHGVRPLQAAIMANDFEMVKEMKPYFDKIPNGMFEMQEQILQIYKKSLQVYLNKQAAKIAHLKSLKPCPAANLAEAQAQYDAYFAALNSNDIVAIFDQHSHAQKNNVFDFAPYITAIYQANESELNVVMKLINARTLQDAIAVANSTGVAATQTDAARAKSFDDLTLVEKLNQFREKFVEHMREEIIFNPNHIIEVRKACYKIPHGTLQFFKYVFQITVCQINGWTQRNAAESVKQGMRQGIYFFSIYDKHLFSRPSYFNKVVGNESSDKYFLCKNSVPDVSLVDSSIPYGLGYSFACDDLHITLNQTPSLLERYNQTKQNEFREIIIKTQSNQPYRSVIPSCCSAM